MHYFLLEKYILMVFLAIKVPKESSNKAFFMQETKYLFALPYIESRSPTFKRTEKAMKIKFSSFVFHLKMS